MYIRAAPVLFCIAAISHAQSINPESAVRAVVEKFAALRNAHDGKKAAETYTSDAAYIGVTGQFVQGRAALADVWGSVKGEARRTITSVSLPAPHIAIAHVTAEFNDSPPLKETFVVIKKDSEWLIAIHEATQP